MTTTTWDEGPVPPFQYTRGLPAEIHFWAYGGNVFLLRDTDTPEVPTWCRWNEGVAIKDVGAEFFHAEARAPQG